MWAIVLTLALPFGENETSRLAPMFKTSEACESAGDAWLKSLPIEYWIRSSFECVKA